MAESFDLVVIGTGSAASSVATRCRKAGWSVAVVDSWPFGGTCALRGCDPKKVLVGAAEAVDWSRRMAGRGVRSPGIGIEWSELMTFKRSFTDPVPSARAAGFARAGITAVAGRARFTAPDTVLVADRELHARHVVIAAGGRPATLDVPGAEHLVTSDAFLDLDVLPRRLVFVGGGYISFELSHVAVRAGAEVTVLHRGARPLEAFDPDLVDLLVARSRALGIDVRLQTAVTGIERIADGFRVRATGTAGNEEWLADAVVHGAGRVPDVDDLGLDAAGIEHGPRGVKVNEFLQSVSRASAYAAGDAADTAGLPLTPVAGYEGGIVAANLLEGRRHTADYAGVASVVFTVPPLAAVGLQEARAREGGAKFRVNHQETSGWYASRRVAEETSAHKVLVEEGSGRILGAHLLGTGADDLVNLFALAIHKGLTVSDLKDMLFAYPTHASNLAYML